MKTDINAFKSRLADDEAKLFTIGSIFMRLGIATYCVAAIAIPLILKDFVWFFAFLFGATIYIPLICLPYYFIKVFIGISYNSRLTAKKICEIKRDLSHNIESEAEE